MCFLELTADGSVQKENATVLTAQQLSCFLLETVFTHHGVLELLVPGSVNRAGPDSQDSRVLHT